MIKKSVAIVLAVLFAAAPSRADELFPAPLGGPESAYAMAHEFDKMVALLSDDVLRDVVCRVSHERYTPESLGLALGVPREAILRRLDVLGSWGLTRLMPWQGGHMVVEPVPGRGEQTLRRWARKYCPAGDACGVPERDEEQAAHDSPKSDRSENVGAASAPGAPPVWRRKHFFDRYEEATKRIDDINKNDPERIPPDARGSPRALFLSRARLDWLGRLAPLADDFLKIATRAYGLARWEIARESYGPELQGYHQWRTALAVFRVDKISRILDDVGYSPNDIKRVRNLLLAVGADQGGEAQMLRDIDGIVFFHNEFGPLSNKVTDLELQNIVLDRWTVLSWKGRRYIRSLNLPRSQTDLIVDILVDSGDKGDMPPAKY